MLKTEKLLELFREEKVDYCFELSVFCPFAKNGNDSNHLIKTNCPFPYRCKSYKEFQERLDRYLQRKTEELA